jgi:flavin reductase (DIM6/NTAB) family NADH-FMN oxidoreductase RutF
MAIDRQQFVEIMASFPSGVAIVTTLDAEGAPRGLTTSAVSSVSAEPPLLLVCVDRGSRTLPALQHAKRFVVNFMADGRAELCLKFASKEEDKFAQVEWQPNRHGLPILHRDAIAWAECLAAEEIEAGDHLIMLGLVEEGRPPAADAVPLMYYRRSWGAWKPTPE